MLRVLPFKVNPVPMGSLRKNGRLGDPALPSLSSNSFHAKHFHYEFLESAATAGSLLRTGSFCGLAELEPASLTNLRICERCRLHAV
jgi:hypothetical protein